MKPPGILAKLIMPAPIIALAMVLAAALTEHYFLAAYLFFGFLCACAALRWAWPRDPKPPKPAPLPRAWVRR